MKLAATCHLQKKKSVVHITADILTTLQLGHGESKDELVPRRVEALVRVMDQSRDAIAGVECGGFHSAAYTGAA